MALKDIISITGKSGLYRIISRTNNGIIVESLDERKSKMKVNANFQIAVLEEITIYTQDGSDLHLRDIFKNIQQQDGEKTSVSHKAKPADLREYFENIAPNHDPDRVYPSDIKKMVQWYNILSEQDMLNLEDEEGENEGSNESEDNSNENKEEENQQGGSTNADNASDNNKQ